MNKISINKGYRFTTSEGYAVCDSYNGHIVYCTEHETDIDGIETGNTNDMMLTLDEVAHKLKEFDCDGRNCEVAWVAE